MTLAGVSLQTLRNAVREVEIQASLLGMELPQGRTNDLVTAIALDAMRRKEDLDHEMRTLERHGEAV